MINCYYYAPHNHTFLSHYIREDFARMRELGTDVVSFCIQEDQLTNWHQKRIHNLLEMAHDAGLAVHAVPNRWAGLVAGWLDGFGRFTLDHYDTIIRGKNGKTLTTSDGNGEMVSCTQNPKVRSHMEKSITTMMTKYEFDGVIWDEPHSSVCYCEYCLREAGGEPTHTWQEAQTARFLDEMSACVLSLRPETIISAFVMPHMEGLLRALLLTENIHYLGSDGHVRSNDHVMHRMKDTIFEAHKKFAPLIHAAGKKTFFLLEAQRHRDEDLADYCVNIDKAFALPMDHLMYYYSAHEMSVSNEQVFNEVTWNALRKRKSSR
jgi:hypothetical protein